ncbi:MAG: polyprenyl synthetase family protein [Candidatus Heimdallarchaeaceae archaeon]
MFMDYYHSLVSSINRALDAFLSEQIDSVKDNSFLEFFYRRVHSFLSSGGKRIRPVLLLLSAGSISPSIFSDSLYRISLSVELLHNASLIHDDIMDNADTRRGFPAFHRFFTDYSFDTYSFESLYSSNYGLSMGILGGDLVYNLSYRTLHSSDFSPSLLLRVAAEFNEGFLRVIKGVIFETDLMARFEVTEKEYFEMIDGKTAALFEKSARMGAILADGTSSQIDALGKFAKNAGLAFQVVDDIIGVFGNPKKTGKPVDSDIREGKKTILLIKALENASSDQKKSLYSIVGNRNASSEDISLVRDIFKDTGALQYARSKAEELYETCKYFLDTSDPAIDKTYKDYLLELAQMGIHREK